MTRSLVTRRPLWLVVIALTLSLHTGCTSKPPDFENADDQLRKENLDLRDQVAALEQKLELSLAQVQAIEALTAATQPAIAGVGVSGLPRATVVQFDRHTGAVDTNGDGSDDLLRAYLHTLDQQGRFIPVAARATLQAVVIAPGQIPSTFAELTLQPADLDKAYRTGLTGTHYTIELPLPKPESLNPSQLPSEATLKLTLTDASTGATITCEKQVKWSIKKITAVTP